MKKQYSKPGVKVLGLLRAVTKTCLSDCRVPPPPAP